MLIVKMERVAIKYELDRMIVSEGMLILFPHRNDLLFFSKNYISISGYCFFLAKVYAFMVKYRRHRLSASPLKGGMRA